MGREAARRRVCGAALAAVAAGALALPALAATDDLDLVSRATGGAPADWASPVQAISGDGRHVAFTSFADNLSAEDDNAFGNIFARDVQARTTTLVSRAAGPGGTAADGGSNVPAMSADGRHVAFESSADNLSGEDDNVAADIFVRDLQAGTTTLVSRAAGAGGAGSDAGSFAPAISADGRHVAFESDADNLSGEDLNTARNVFARDLQAGTTTLVSRVGGPGGGGAFGASSAAAISADGRHVAFVSDAPNLSADDVNGVANVFVRDLQAATPRPW